MSRNSNKRNSSNRSSTGSDIARSTLKVFLSNGDSRSVKCGEATDIKVRFYPFCFKQSFFSVAYFSLQLIVVLSAVIRLKTLQEFLVGREVCIKSIGNCRRACRLLTGDLFVKSFSLFRFLLYFILFGHFW